MSKKALLNTILIAIVLGGILSYSRLGKLEDAEISIRTALVVTSYPGASAHEVELEVTDPIEKALQKLENIEDISSRSTPGLSTITVNLEVTFPSKQMPQAYDHLRRKVSDMKNQLPQGANEPIVVDDFGDVYGIFAAVTADGYAYDDFFKYVEFIKRELLDVKGIKRVELFGTQIETVEILFSSQKLANLNINPVSIIQAMYQQGQVVNPGSIVSNSERIRLSVGNKYTSLDEIEDILVNVPKGGSFRLGDVCEVEDAFYTPKQNALLFNGERAISLAVSIEKGENVIEVGERYDAKMTELAHRLPAGIEVHSIFSQPDRVSDSISGFVVNLIASVLIVMMVLLISMGFRSGLLISSGLLFTILSTFIGMLLFDIQLQRVSLAAIIVAMGMLVDNSVVIADGILIDLKHGIAKKLAFTSIVKQTALPLLGATLIAILAFMPLGLSPGVMGEYLGTLFSVLAISLFMSWVFATIQTPYMASLFYKKSLPGSKKKQTGNPYDSRFYKSFRDLIKYSLAHKTIFLGLSILLLVFSLYSFRFVRVDFMSTLDYNQFVVEYKLPRGTDISIVESDLKEISDELLTWDEIINVTASSGSSPARYTLLRPMSTGGPYFGEFIIDVADYDATITAGKKILNYISKNYPDAEVRKRVYGPISSEYGVEAQFAGPDPVVLKELAEQAKVIMGKEPFAVHVTDDWKNPVKYLFPEYAIDKASKLGIARSDVANALLVSTSGLTVGVMNEGITTKPIVLKLKENIGNDVDKLTSIPVWGLQHQASVPLSQVTDSIQVKWEQSIVHRYNGQRAIRIGCDPVEGVLAGELEKILIPQISEIPLPDGYTLEWFGTSRRSRESQGYLFANLPLALGLMLIIVIALFNNIKQSMIVFTIFPFAFMGISLGFNLTGAAFTFVGTIGALGLIGMMIKNVIVLLDEINHNLRVGKTRLRSIILATQSRLRPVVLASATTILGMLPLVFDVMFQSLAITIIFGLLVGTIVTLVIVPVMYAVFFKVDMTPLKKARAWQK
ncbi:MAG: efflux RND transporter permease subunit [Cytophagales bacterium]|nr:efflux RND transporter permease subunit [Cytophagales bacterium]